MKTIISITTLLYIVFLTNVDSITNQNTTFGEDLSRVIVKDPMNLLRIKGDIRNKQRDYLMTGSLTIVKTPKTGDIAKSLDASFRNSVIIAYKDRDYVQANVEAKRNDKAKSDEVRIYVTHDNRGQGKVDKNKVKINWKGSLTSGEVAGSLSNVTVLYQEDSILITGTLQKKGYVIGVSLAITREAKLI